MLLLDEPMVRMNPAKAMTMVNDLRRIRDTGITLVVVAHNMTTLMALAEISVEVRRELRPGPGRLMEG
jgi:branched-chain amino acid transport system ATP-binding protein